MAAQPQELTGRHLRVEEEVVFNEISGHSSLPEVSVLPLHNGSRAATQTSHGSGVWQQSGLCWSWTRTQPGRDSQGTFEEAEHASLLYLCVQTKLHSL